MLEAVPEEEGVAEKVESPIGPALELEDVVVDVDSPEVKPALVTTFVADKVLEDITEPVAEPLPDKLVDPWIGPALELDKLPIELINPDVLTEEFGAKTGLVGGVDVDGGFDPPSDKLLVDIDNPDVPVIELEIAELGELESDLPVELVLPVELKEADDVVEAVVLSDEELEVSIPLVIVPEIGPPETLEVLEEVEDNLDDRPEVFVVEVLLTLVVAAEMGPPVTVELPDKVVDSPVPDLWEGVVELVDPEMGPSVMLELLIALDVDVPEPLELLWLDVEVVTRPEEPRVGDELNPGVEVEVVVLNARDVGPDAGPRDEFEIEVDVEADTGSPELLELEDAVESDVIDRLELDVLDVEPGLELREILELAMEEVRVVCPVEELALKVEDEPGLGSPELLEIAEEPIEVLLVDEDSELVDALVELVVEALLVRAVVVMLAGVNVLLFEIPLGTPVELGRSVDVAVCLLVVSRSCQ
jgi:hypothetical protein